MLHVKILKLGSLPCINACDELKVFGQYQQQKHLFAAAVKRRQCLKRQQHTMPEMYQPPHSQSFSIWRNLLNIYIHVVITNINTGALGIDLVSRSTTATAEVVHQNTILTLIHYGIPRELQVPEMLPCNIYPQLWDVTVDSQAILPFKDSHWPHTHR